MKLRPFCLAAVLVFSTLQVNANNSAVSNSVPNDLEKVFRENDAENGRGPRMVKGQVITIDTRDQVTCARIQSALLRSNNLQGTQDPSTLCEQDAQNPMTSLVILTPADQVTWQREVKIDPLTSTEANLFTGTRNTALAAVGVAGILYMLPESVSKWDRSKMKNLGKSWQENVNEGPVVDKDDFAINYIGHPYSGAAYYQIARHAGVGPLGSFGYSLIMSSFFWEYGIEAFAETPSIQDLWITPLLGSILGEVFFRTEKRIRANGGTVAGSKKLGSVSMVLMNPMGALSTEINQLFGNEVVKEARARWVVRQQNFGSTKYNQNSETPGFWGFEIQVRH